MSATHPKPRRCPPRRLAPLATLALWLLAAQTPAGEGQAEKPHLHHAPPAVGSGAVEDHPQRQIPDVSVVDQNGEEARFWSDLVEGKVVAMNFVFTTCTTVCRPMGAIFAKLRRDLGTRAGDEVHLISISIDPVTDTPQRLKAWSEQLGGGPGWTLVTGRKNDIDRLLKSLEVFTPDFVDHSPTVLVGNARTGHWKRAYGLAPTSKLAGLIDEMIRKDGPDGPPPPASPSGLPPENAANVEGRRLAIQP